MAGGYAVGALPGAGVLRRCGHARQGQGVGCGHRSAISSFVCLVKERALIVARLCAGVESCVQQYWLLLGASVGRGVRIALALGDACCLWLGASPCAPSNDTRQLLLYKEAGSCWRAVADWLPPLLNCLLLQA